jgi:hypothetical protein
MLPGILTQMGSDFSALKRMTDVLSKSVPASATAAADATAIDAEMPELETFES